MNIMKCALLESDQLQQRSQNARRHCTRTPAYHAVILPSLDCLDSPRNQLVMPPARCCLPRLWRDSFCYQVRFALIVALVASFFFLKCWLVASFCRLVWRRIVCGEVNGWGPRSQWGLWEDKLYLPLQCHHQNVFCVTTGSSYGSHFNVSLIVKGKGAGQSP